MECWGRNINLDKHPGANSHASSLNKKGWGCDFESKLYDRISIFFIMCCACIFAHRAINRDKPLLEGSPHRLHREADKEPNSALLLEIREHECLVFNV